MKMTYQPSPIDNKQVVLAPSLEALIEMLARNNHELWARRRMDEGWTYGPSRDDVEKGTPVMVPYEELPEGEKQYDRANARETLRTIISLGWSIQPPNLDSERK
jgi:hypothetical protein